MQLYLHYLVHQEYIIFEESIEPPCYRLNNCSESNVTCTWCNRVSFLNSTRIGSGLVVHKPSDGLRTKLPATRVTKKKKRTLKTTEKRTISSELTKLRDYSVSYLCVSRNGDESWYLIAFQAHDFPKSYCTWLVLRFDTIIYSCYYIEGEVPQT